MANLISKFFRVATEGDTTDGREIQRDWIKDMAETYDREKYAARVWLEHIRGVLPDGDFGAYGDVMALESREVEDGKLALFAQIAPLPSLVKLNQAKQKLYTSIEVAENFAKSGKAYLMGLAVTDSPASLGTEVLQFSAKNPDASPFASRKINKDNLFTAAAEVASLEFQEEKPHVSIADKVRSLFARNDKQKEATDRLTEDFTQAIEVLVEHVQALEQKVDSFAGLADANEALTNVRTELTGLQKLYSDLVAKLESQESPESSSLPPATGSSGQALTDC